MSVHRVLYSGTRNASSWALRAWLALRELDIPFEERVVDIRRPERLANLSQIAEFSPQGAVPVLIDRDAIIFDSLAIMEYANELGGGSLLPANVRSRARARSLLAWVHSGLSGLCASISFESTFHPARKPFTAAESIQAARIFKACERDLAARGGPYLAGDLSLADLAFVPVARRLLSRAPDLAPWPRTHAWMQRLLSRPSVLEWMEEAEALPPVLEE